MRIQSTDSAGLSKTLGYNNESNWHLVNAEEIAKSVLEVTADRDDLWLRLNDYRVCKEILDRKKTEQDDILKAMMASVRRMGKSWPR